MRRFFILISLVVIFGLSCGSPTDSSNPPYPGQSQPPPSVHFFSFGDWGTGDGNQQAVAERTKAVCQTRRCDFGLFLGDNFYDVGIASVNDPQWQTKYQVMYSSLGIPLYAVLGNHDWDAPADPQAQVDFDLMDKDPLWRMPAFYYSFRFPEQGPSLLEVFVINSNNFASDPAGQAWLGQAIAASTAPWKIVALHHPIFTNGSHPPDEKGNYPTLMPIICGKVHLLLSGHNHLFSHMKNDRDACGYDQLVIGTGGRALYDPTPSANVVYSEKSFGLGFFQATSTSMTFYFFRADGTQAYNVTWQKS